VLFQLKPDVFDAGNATESEKHDLSRHKAILVRRSK
jgi:hypothetical protein